MNHAAVQRNAISHVWHSLLFHAKRAQCVFLYNSRQLQMHDIRKFPPTENGFSQSLITINDEPPPWSRG
jgi:hypothetical protein